MNSQVTQLLTSRFTKNQINKTQNKYKFIRLRKKCLIAPATWPLKIVITGLDLKSSISLVEAKA